MYLLDTDHVSILERKTGPEAERLRFRLGCGDKATTVITYEEQLRGWLSWLAQARSLTEQIERYRKLNRMLDHYRSIQVLDFDELAAAEFVRLQRQRVRIGAMDLKIAAITLSQNAILLSRNLRDFRQVPACRSKIGPLNVPLVMKHSSLSLILLSLCLGLCAAAQRQPSPAKPVKVTGTKVSLMPPAGFTPSEQFPGFMHEASGASIMVTEMPAPYSKITEAFTKEALATKGMILLARRPHTISGKAGLLLHLRQVAQGTAFLKWMVATGTEKETVLITATFPEAVKLKWSAALEKAVLSAQWNDAAEIDQFAGLNFSIKDHPEMKIARRVSNMLLLTKDGTLPGKPNNDPMLIVGSAISNVAIGDLKQFAAARLQEINQITGTAIKQQSPVTIGGLAGSEIIAEAEWQNPSAPVTVFQIVLQSEKSYFIIQGFAPRAEQQKYLAIYRGIAQSFQKKQAIAAAP